MRIVIDVQGAQSSGSAFRGIGRYTMGLAQGIARWRGHHDVIIAASDAFPESLPLLRATFAPLLPPGHFRVWQCPRGISAADDTNHARRRAAAFVREAYLAALRPDVVLVSSLFEGLTDDAVASIGTLHDIPTAVVLYDLIPLIRRETYLSHNTVIEKWYEAQLDHLRRADLLLAISASSSKEAEDHLGFPAGQTVNIGAAADPQFHRQKLPLSTLDRVRARYGLNLPFVMYTGGIDHRKNLDQLVAAFARLPARLREAHQLAIICKADDDAQDRLRTLARREGLGASTLIFTGFVPEDDLIHLYHACAAFVFPSWHEGFGLPALEAMACGAPVIASNASSLPEVVGLDEALFDPLNPASIANSLQQVLEDRGFRERLISHGLQQAARFSWDITAQRAVKALEALHLRHSLVPRRSRAPTPRPRLAYVSPLPPEQSGISDYSAELIPELSRFYEIEIIASRPDVGPDWLRSQFPIRTPDWLSANPSSYDRILYQFGNSAFHQHMFDLLRDAPGVVTLHDFFLSGVAWWMEGDVGRSGHLAKVLYRSHGYAAAEQRFRRGDINSVIWDFPCNADVLSDAIGIIVHGPDAVRLARQWYGPDTARDWTIIPLLRAPAFGFHRPEARRRIGLPEDALVTCSFGGLSATKLNHIALEAWLTSAHADRPDAYLVFVGDHSNDDYGRALVATARNSRAAERIRITGRTDQSTYRDYLAAADIAVQLRTLSRGETSAAVLDCMNYGIATIVNANGSMADLAAEAVWKLPDKFERAQLAAMLDDLARDTGKRKALGQRARQRILRTHAPRACAAKYHETIEVAYREADATTRGAVSSIARSASGLTEADLAQISGCLAQNGAQPIARQFLVDISGLMAPDSEGRIHSYPRELVLELLRRPPAGFRVEPIHTSATTKGYRYARRWTMNLLGVPSEGFEDELVDAHGGDIFLALYPNHRVSSGQADLYRRWRTLGVRTVFMIDGQSPARMPRQVPNGGNKPCTDWLDIVAEADKALCLSRSVADDFRARLDERGARRSTPIEIGWFCLGSDVENTAPNRGMPVEVEALLTQLGSRPSLLMVDTLEPRKGYGQTLNTFDRLWQNGIDVNLLIVRPTGWMDSELVSRLQAHPEAGKRLFWIAGADDAYLSRLVEAARHGLAIIARDIQAFREIAGVSALFFSCKEPDDLEKAILDWFASREAPLPSARTAATRPLTWTESVDMLVQALDLPPRQSILSGSAATV